MNSYGSERLATPNSQPTDDIHVESTTARAAGQGMTVFKCSWRCPFMKIHEVDEGDEARCWFGNRSLKPPIEDQLCRIDFNAPYVPLTLRNEKATIQRTLEFLQDLIEEVEAERKATPHV